MFDQSDATQFSNRGIDIELINRQLDNFRTGFPFINLNRPAVIGDGILMFDQKERERFCELFEKSASLLKVCKFVPASGAASRMFKHLFEFRDTFTPDEAGLALFQKDQHFNSVHYFFNHLTELAFYDDIQELAAGNGMSLEELLQDRNYKLIIDYILSEKGLNYANLPKALIKFHRYPDGSRTAAEEHLVEASAYACDQQHHAHIHFTISPEHQEKFTELFMKVRHQYEKQFGLIYNISFSIQKPSTDTIAVDELNQPIRNQDNTILFRPGGHGALLENLDDINADIVFIKNIDNIVPDRLKETTFQYKKLIGGYLMFIKQMIDKFLVELTSNKISPEKTTEISKFATQILFQDLPDDFESLALAIKVETLISVLNRPVRVCGMVKNEGEPGGGPFWVTGEDGRKSLQIVESSQIDLKNPDQKTIVDQSTHFNPVDLVCSIKNFRGDRFNLKDFVDEKTGFISLKSSGGKTLKAQELPGLWNGAMAKWITIFIEVPIITFNPVKTVNDLLRKEHLNN